MRGNYDVKACPQCGMLAFSDMDVCYGCLHEFADGRDDACGEEDERVPTEAYVRAGTGDADAVGEPARSGYLLVISTHELDVSVPLGAAGLTIGRGSSNDVVLHARAVSRRHVTLVPREGGLEARDLNARNPAMLAGRPLRGARQMVPGDVLDVCGTTFTLTRCAT